jgi:hypothetical protein
MVIEKKFSSIRRTRRIIFFKKMKIRVTFEDNGCAGQQKVARLIVVLCNLPRSCDFPMKPVETLSPRDYSSEIIARLKHGDDAKTLDKAWCAVSLRNSHRALSSVLSGVIGMSCLHDFHAHDLLLVNCFCMRKVVLCN